MAIVIEDEPELEQYTLWSDDRRVGYAKYIKREDAIEIPSVVLDPELRGSGLGSTLVRYVLDDLRDSTDLPVIPSCPFVAVWIRRNPEYQALVEPRGDSAK